MRKIAFAVAAVVTCWAAPARAETLPVFEGLPTTYTPGTAFTFTVRVPQLADFAAFQVDLVFATDMPDPPLLVSAQPAPAALGQYVFPSNVSFASDVTWLPGSPEVLLTLRDSTGAPVFTQPGVNDTLAVITVLPGASFVGPITISLGSETLFDVSRESPRYDSPPAVTITQADGPSPVPAPAGVVLLGLGGLLLGVRNVLCSRTSPAPH